MIAPTATDIPNVTVKVNGTEPEQRVLRDLLEVSVEEHLDGPSTFSIRFSAWNEERLDFGLADDMTFKIGGEVEIAFGYNGNLTTMMLGDMTGLDVNFGAGEIPSMTVHGFDRRHRMQRGTRTEPYANSTDSDIASTIAQKYGLQSQVEDSKIKHEQVTQDDLSDLNFLKNRADLIGYEVLVLGKTLHFRPRQIGTRPSLTLDATLDLLSFSAHQQASNQLSRVEVRGWDPMAKDIVIGQASSDEQTFMDGEGGAKSADEAFGESKLTVASFDVATKEAADKLARELLDRMALALVSGDGECLGRPDLHAGSIIELKSLGQRMTGTYYVQKTTHRYAPQQGYRTRFTVQRNAT